MRKIIVLLSAVLLFASCEGPMGPTGPEGLVGPEGPAGPIGPGGGSGGATWHITKFTVNQDDWTLSGEPGSLESYYYADKDISQLTQQVFDKGTVLGYIYVEPDVKVGLPYVYHQAAKVGGVDKFWTQTYYFDFVKGSVRVYVTFSDFETNNYPGNETFGIVLMW